VAFFLQDGKATESSDVHDPIIPFSGFTTAGLELPKARLIDGPFTFIESDPALLTNLACSSWCARVPSHWSLTI
jgi:hypothetical protein